MDHVSNRKSILAPTDLTIVSSNRIRPKPVSKEEAPVVSGESALMSNLNSDELSPFNSQDSEMLNLDLTEPEPEAETGDLQPCSVSCSGRKGRFPSLACSRCCIMFHAECVPNGVYLADNFVCPVSTFQYRNVLFYCRPFRNAFNHRTRKELLLA